MRNNDVITARYALLAGVLLFFVFGVAMCAPRPSRAGAQEAPEPTPVVRGLTRADALLAAQACVHENSWQGGIGGTFDCGAQIQVFVTRRLAHEPFQHVIERLMPRFAAGRTTRSWVRQLPFGPMREDPPGWPALYPARHDDELWHGVFTRVSGFLRGREPLPCAQPPEAWFGRYVDHEAIEHRLTLGWREIDCNPGGSPATQTLEMYMARP
jgi:hypothetical protein